MKTILLAVGLIGCSAAASAQLGVPGPSGLIGTSAPFPGNPGWTPRTNISPPSITPTMQREREARLRLVLATFPDLPTTLAAAPARQRAALYAKAEHKAVWARINARASKDASGDL
jgi:hypothetical protein